MSTERADVYLVKPIATPSGFRWRVDACTFPSSKSDGKTLTYFGTPTRRMVGTYQTRELAESAAAILNGIKS